MRGVSVVAIRKTTRDHEVLLLRRNGKQRWRMVSDCRIHRTSVRQRGRLRCAR